MRRTSNPLSIGRITPHELFCELNQRRPALLLVDVREAPARAIHFAKLHAPRAMELEVDASEESAAEHDEQQELHQRILAHMDADDSVLRVRRSRRVVLYAGAGDAFDDGESFGFRLADALAREGIVAAVLALDGGFEAYEKRYPFSCCAVDELTEDQRSVTWFPSEILEDGSLFLGNAAQAANADAVGPLGITHIVNASNGAIGSEHKDTLGVKYIDVKVEDVEGARLDRHYERVYAFMTQPGAKVLVHCRAGMSRSASLVIYYLMRRNQWSLVDAVDFVTAARPTICPNLTFRQQLRAAEIKLLGKASVDSSEHALYGLGMRVQEGRPARVSFKDVLDPVVEESGSKCVVS